MTSRDFCYWLQGHFEIANPKKLDEHETEMIRRHLALVFKHEIDPSMPDHDGQLQAIHDGTSVPVKKPQSIPLTNGPKFPLGHTNGPPGLLRC